MRTSSILALVCLHMVCALTVKGVAGAAEDLRLGQTESTSDSSAEEVATDPFLGSIDDMIALMILEDGRICCQPPRSVLQGGDLAWGPLFWWRLKILCPQLRPTAIC